MKSEALLQQASLAGLPAQGKVVVGFSGGADSTALAHWLSGRVEKDRILLAHVNHLLRGEEAERDEAAARELARSLGLRFVVSRQDVRAIARERGMGLEECGRAVRYELFDSLAPGENDRILTAHNADDNAETLLLHLCRGAGLNGLQGIPPQRGKILRPFLSVSREEIEAYCRENSLPYVKDSSNFSNEYTRNRIRWEVLPVLRELNPRILEALGQTAQLLRQDGEYLFSQAEEALEKARHPYGLRAESLAGLAPAVRREALRLWLLENGCEELEKKHLDAAADCCLFGGGVSLPGGVVVKRAQGVLFTAGKEAAGYSFPVKVPENRLELPLPNGNALILEKKWGPFPKSEQKIHNLDFKNALSCGIITGTLTVRTRRPGDRFSPQGENGADRKLTKSLKQVFQECGMPAYLRGSAALLECGGELIWCQGAGASAGARAKEDDPWALAVTVKET